MGRCWVNKQVNKTPKFIPENCVLSWCLWICHFGCHSNVKSFNWPLWTSVIEPPYPGWTGNIGISAWFCLTTMHELFQCPEIHFYTLKLWWHSNTLSPSLMSAGSVIINSPLPCGCILGYNTGNLYIFVSTKTLSYPLDDFSRTVLSITRLSSRAMTLVHVQGNWW